ncbi:transporter substrate-binding domain-containing protein [Gymnodinialimonas hymeniacidonis]|uniref:ABC transporter substrate-binding protein n=1 Tax=Gymnodinialimonas hymeniacidonis TaxID=3126508 RepID=UPI0034C5CD51
MRLKTLILTACLASPAAAQDITIGTAFPYDPFISRDETGTLKGAEPEILAAICARAGWTCSWTEMPFEDLIPALQDGRIDIAANGLGHTIERAAEVHMACPYYPVLGDPPSGTFFTTDPDHDPRSGPVGVTAGSIFEATLLREGYVPVPFEDETVALQALQDGLVQAHFGSRTYPAQIHVDGDLHEAGEIETGAIGFAFALNPTNPEMIEIFETVQADISSDGTLAGIAETHLGFSHPDPISLCDRTNPIS